MTYHECAEALDRIEKRLAVIYERGWKAFSEGKRPSMRLVNESERLEEERHRLHSYLNTRARP